MKRGRKPTIDAADITRAAIAIADAEGLAAVSMARVAQEMGNATMALYRHVKSKDELLRLMADAAFEDPPPLLDGGWRDKFEVWAKALLAGIRQRPWFLQIPLNGPPSGPKSLAWFDSALGALDDTPLEPGEKVGVVMSLMTFVHGEAWLSISLTKGFENDPAQFTRQYGQRLREIVDPRRMPALAKIVAAGVFDMDDLLDADDMAAEFDFGLHLFLEGVAAHIGGRS
ncbi:TetR/AcrR family transcriptional regulator [Lentzea sp. BCCO 10_0061]|uniref:TetR/AcrR family transcriptional regulator n=1 Tax=Lentzea sokolovensis TaxID=3095429 RepID=A0ABU4UMW7_9PSEU|nr:TetR/AcrR family transcriptional regulator [Lentzea sp. BCCO 10_0061]MDX8140842.1 TetR/AcrR family transcriptional regulator [Lentzea sp. BCCO 10_0061]